MKRIPWVTVCIAVGLLLSGNIFGQGQTGQISGSVVDTTGSVVVGATVEVTNEGTSETRRVTTDNTGAFVAPELLAGSYRVRVTVSGFKTYTETGIALSATERRVLAPIRLELGALTESLSVTAASESLQTQSSEHSTEVSTIQVMEAPDRGRNYLGLLNLMAGWSIPRKTTRRQAPPISESTAAATKASRSIWTAFRTWT